MYKEYINAYNRVTESLWGFRSTTYVQDDKIKYGLPKIVSKPKFAVYLGLCFLYTGVEIYRIKKGLI